MDPPTIETRPQVPPPRASSREVFVAPRVIDANAFDEHAETLRSLLDETSSQSAVLRRINKDALALGVRLHTLTSSSKELTGSLASASARAHSLIDQLTRLVTTIQQREQDARDAERELTLRICEAQQRHRNIISSLESLLDQPAVLSRLEALENRLDALESAQPDDATAHPSHWRNAINQERTRARDLLEETRDLRKVVETAKTQVANTILRASDVADRAEQAADQTSDLLESIAQHTASLTSLLERAETLLAVHKT
ncbi:MAG: hypothetical protein ACF8GE_06755 [Phycisphaerales bacterium JB043]